MVGKGEGQSNGRFHFLRPERGWVANQPQHLRMPDNLGMVPATPPDGLLRLVCDPAALRGRGQRSRLVLITDRGTHDHRTAGGVAR
ncbi:MAG: hypothetical protein WCN98_06840 [Verrucomicrobiaceae bacterium]